MVVGDDVAVDAITESIFDFTWSKSYKFKYKRNIVYIRKYMILSHVILNMSLEHNFFRVNSIYTVMISCKIKFT
jgi:hypothetical protein